MQLFYRILRKDLHNYIKIYYSIEQLNKYCVTELYTHFSIAYNIYEVSGKNII